MDLPEDQKAKLKDLKATGADKFFKDAELPKRAADALRAQKKRQAAERLAAGERWQDHNLVFCHRDGHPYTRDDLNWRFGQVTRRAGIGHWRAHEGRHTAVSVMSSNGVPIQDITDTVGHNRTEARKTSGAMGIRTPDLLHAMKPAPSS